MILYVGEALIDFIPVTDSTGTGAYRPAPGGSPYNSAIAAARLGTPAAFVSRLSRDFFGDMLASRLTENGVDTGGVVRTDLPTTLAFVERTPTGEARYAFFAAGSADRSLNDDDLATLPAGTDAVAFGSISLIADPAGSAILAMVEREQSRTVVSFDPNVRPILVSDEADYRSRLDRGIRAATILKISDEDLAWIVGHDDHERGAAEMLALGPQLVVVTAGDKGALAVCGQHAVRVAAEPTEVADTIGAGDSFHAALLVWLRHHQLLARATVGSLNPAQLESMLSFASIVASRACSRPGADPPRMAELGDRALA